MAIKTMFVVMSLVPWNKVTADGKAINSEGIGIGFLPVFDSEEVARRKFPNHPITPIAQEVPDDEAEISERPEAGDGNDVLDGSADIHVPGQG